MRAVKPKTRDLSLTLFGPLQLSINSEPIREIASDKVRGLLAYLAVESDHAHRRDTLVEIFWPNRAIGTGRNNLKQALSNLRKALGDRNAASPYLLVSRDKIQFNKDSSSWIDTNAFIELIELSKAHNHQSLGACEHCEQLLQNAAEIYQGDFLSAFSLADSHSFEEWALLNREAFRRRMSDALQRLVKLYEERGDFSEACKYARRVVKLEPWNEENHRLLMRLLMLSGRRSEALRQYQACEVIMADEFGIEPARETTTLYEMIRAEELVSISKPASNALTNEQKDHRIKPETISAGRGKQFRIPKIPRWILGSSALLIVGIAMLALFGKMSSDENAAGIANENENPFERTVLSDSIAPSTGNEVGSVQEEREVLETLYLNTNGENWTYTSGWMSEDPPCSWYGLKCIAGSVSEINLTGNNLEGIFPKELLELPNLTVLDLHSNELIGSIPPELGKLKKLKILDLSFNQLSGEIPMELGQLQNLMVLSLAGNNHLQGPIPPELGNLTNLQNLTLSSYEGGTQLSGSIPVELGNLTRLTYLELANSLVSGQIPSELGNLTNLNYLDLSNNPLSGTIPSELGNLTNLRNLSLGEGTNDLHGPLPMSLTNLKKIRTFFFNDTDLCEPSDPLLQTWLEGILELQRTNVLCSP